MKRVLLTAVALSSILSLPVQAAEVHKIDPTHSEVSFQIRHMVTQVRGNFNEYEGVIHLDPANLEGSKVDLKIKAASIDTNLADRDKHLRAPDFFDVEKYPEITFRSTKIKKTGKDTYDVTGNFTMRGVTKQITLPVTYLGSAKDPWGGQRAGFETSTTLDRKDYGINWNTALDNGGVILGDDVKVSINLETIQQKDANAKGK
ncbi:MAG TPA: YceI family protein [Thermoanaerobaculia bacterium]|nr:YceI family protein [Thermoanaerobaculia bacterium]